MEITNRIVNLANKLTEASLEALDDEKTMFITDSVYTISNMIKNKHKFYRILYDRNIKQWMIGSGNATIHAEMVELAYENGWYGDEYLSGLDYFEDGLLEDVFETYTFAPKGMNVDRDRYDDNYFFKLLYDFGSIYLNMNTDWRTSELIKTLGKPLQIINLEELFNHDKRRMY